MRSGIDCRGRQWNENPNLLANDKNLSNKVFGRLTVLFRVQNDKQGNSYWLTHCQCGNYLVVKGTSLRNGHTSSCGCAQKEIVSEKLARNLTLGEQFGCWTVMCRAQGHRGKGAYWHCRCQCGTEKDVPSEALRLGASKSCGCMAGERLSEKHLIDLAGRKFGMLTVLCVSEKRVDKDRYWTVQCDCGTVKDVSGHGLRRGDIASCGCQSMSAGAIVITDLLKNNNIFFETEYVFNDLLSDAGYHLRFDFAILDNHGEIKRLIEYDGKQHFQPIGIFGGQEYFDKLQYHDVLKNQYAISHNIPLVRIPYYEINNITLNDLLNNKYLIKGDHNYGN